jgi:hypothetical protein
METRALAIAFFYAIGTAVGGTRVLVMVAFFIGAVVMALGGVIELLFGVKAPGVARPAPHRRRRHGREGLAGCLGRPPRR